MADYPLNTDQDVVLEVIGTKTAPLVRVNIANRMETLPANTEFSLSGEGNVTIKPDPSILPYGPILSATSHDSTVNSSSKGITVSGSFTGKSGDFNVIATPAGATEVKITKGPGSYYLDTPTTNFQNLVPTAPNPIFKYAFQSPEGSTNTIVFSNKANIHVIKPNGNPILSLNGTEPNGVSTTNGRMNLLRNDTIGMLMKALQSDGKNTNVDTAALSEAGVNDPTIQTRGRVFAPKPFPVGSVLLATTLPRKENEILASAGAKPMPVTTMNTPLVPIGTGEAPKVKLSSEQIQQIMAVENRIAASVETLQNGTPGKPGDTKAFIYTIRGDMGNPSWEMFKVDESGAKPSADGKNIAELMQGARSASKMLIARDGTINSEQLGIVHQYLKQGMVLCSLVHNNPGKAKQATWLDANKKPTLPNETAVAILADEKGADTVGRELARLRSELNHNPLLKDPAPNGPETFVKMNKYKSASNETVHPFEGLLQGEKTPRFAFAQSSHTQLFNPGSSAMTQKGDLQQSALRKMAVS